MFSVNEPEDIALRAKIQAERRVIRAQAAYEATYSVEDAKELEVAELAEIEAENNFDEITHSLANHN